MSGPRGEARSPVFIALAIQLGVFVCIAIFTLAAAKFTALSLPVYGLAIAQGVIAAIVTAAFGFSRPWIIGQLVAPPLLFLGNRLNVPDWVFPVILLLLVLLFWNVARHRVPLFLTNRQTYQAIEQLLPAAPVHVVDLGCGFGGLLRHIAKWRPDARVTGLETAPLPFAVAWVLARLSGCDNLEIRYRDIFNADLGDYDVVYCFLSPAPMPRLFEKARAEMKPGSLLISNSFTVPGTPPDDVVEVDDRRETELLIWRM